MSPRKSPNIIKYCLISSTVAIVLIAISLIPVSKKAKYWNRCLSKTVDWINDNEKGIKDWDQKAKESLAVAVCNGAVYEPKFK